MLPRHLSIALATIVTLALLPAGSGADTGERVSTTADRERINLTIYNGGNSLIHDRRHVALEAGTNAIAWRDVSGNMDATTAIVEDLTTPGGTSVLEQNFNYDLLKPSTLLDKYVGHPCDGRSR